MYKAKVDFEMELATVEFDTKKISTEDLISTVKSVSDSYSAQDVIIIK